MARIIRKKGSKKLYVDYRIDGKRIQRSTGYEDTPDNRRLLETEVIPKLEAQITLGQLTSRSTLFGAYAQEYLESRRDNKSFPEKRYVYDRVIAHFGDMEVNKITRLSVKRYLGTLDIKDDSKRPYLSAIKGILDIALDDEMIDKNVAVGIGLKSAKAKPFPFSEEEVRMILDKAEGTLRNYLGIAFYTGMRSGEILGLMHKDIIEDAIKVQRSISKGRITTPKTEGSMRTVPVFEIVKPFIEDQRKRSTSLYLFDHGGKFISNVTVLGKRKWRKLLEECGLEYRKIYTTRHTFITAMLASGSYKLTTIAKIVGHANIKMIVETYTGFIKDEHMAVDFQEDIFAAKKQKPIKTRQIL